MSSLEPDALDDVSNERLLDAVPDHSVTNLRDVQITYGALFMLATTGENEYGMFLTPEGTSEFVDTGDDSLIIINVDVSGETPQYEGVTVRRLAAEDVSKLGHSYYSSRGRGLDHSITHRTGQSVTAEKIAKYTVERLTRWPREDAVIEFATDELPDGNPVEMLHQFADARNDEWDEHELAAMLSELRADTHRAVSGDTPAIITVRLRTEPDGELRWPTEVPELMAAMRAQYLAKLSERSMSSSEKRNPSKGIGADYLTNEVTDLVGMPADPLAYYTSKQRERFNSFDPSEAWRAHQLSVDHAALLNLSETFTDACKRRVFSTGVYYLPYFAGKPDPEELRTLYDVLYALVEDEDDMRSPLVRAWEASDTDGLRFYMTITNQPNNNRYDVFGESGAEKTLWPLELARAHQDILDSPYIGTAGEPFSAAESITQTSDEDGGSETGTALNGADADEGASGLVLLDDRLEAIDLANYITTGWYLQLTHPEDRPRKDGSYTVTEADRRIQALRNILSGESIAAEELLETYTEQILETEQSDYDTQSLITSQFVQLCAVARAGLLHSTTGDESLCRPTIFTTMDDNDIPTSADSGLSSTDDPLAQFTDGGVDVDAQHKADGEGDGEDDESDPGENRRKRALKLEYFLETSPMIRDDPERRGAFLLGALVAQLSNYQSSSQERGATLMNAYPASTMAPDVAERAHADIIEKNHAYMRQENNSSPFYSELYEPLTEAFGAAPPENWEARQAHIQFYYSLGLAYGQSAMYNLDEVDEDALRSEVERLKRERDDQETTATTDN